MNAVNDTCAVVASSHYFMPIVSTRHCLLPHQIAAVARHVLLGSDGQIPCSPPAATPPPRRTRTPRDILWNPPFFPPRWATPICCFKHKANKEQHFQLVPLPLTWGHVSTMLSSRLLNMWEKPAAAIQRQLSRQNSFKGDASLISPKKPLPSPKPGVATIALTALLVWAGSLVEIRPLTLFLDLRR